MKYIKKFEDSYWTTDGNKYKEGDYVIIKENPEDSYSIIYHDMPYIINIFNIYTGEQIDKFYPLTEDDIIRKMTQDEIDSIEIKRNAEKFNI